MAFTIPEDLNPQLMGLAWMVGRWEGNGHGSWPGEGDFEFGQQVDFTPYGDSLHYVSQCFTLDEQGRPDAPLLMETGFWRPQPDASLEVVLSHPEGWVEVWAGRMTGARIELVTDVVARTTTAEMAYTGGQRLYGNVEEDLMWTFDRASSDQQLQPYLWARLARS